MKYKTVCLEDRVLIIHLRFIDTLRLISDLLKDQHFVTAT